MFGAGPGLYLVGMVFEVVNSVCNLVLECSDGGSNCLVYLVGFDGVDMWVELLLVVEGGMFGVFLGL